MINQIKNEMEDAFDGLADVFIHLITLQEKYSDFLPDRFKDDISDFLDDILSFQDSLMIFESRVCNSLVVD